jgi:hypothetical protein
MNDSSKKILSNDLFKLAFGKGKRSHGHHSGEFSLTFVHRISYLRLGQSI